MTLRQVDLLHEKIKKGVLLAHKRLIEQAKKNDDYLVISKNNKVVRVKARSLK